jgi:uncharacterized protein YjbI with pentapeptide repeats
VVLEEREVRRTVVRLIGAHLRLEKDDPMSWLGHDLDFTGAVFDGGNFRRARFSGGRVSFDGAMFSGGRVHFTRTMFSGGVLSFEGARFSGGRVLFDESRFAGAEVSLVSSIFEGGRVSFAGTDFAVPPSFKPWPGGIAPVGLMLPEGSDVILPEG